MKQKNQIQKTPQMGEALVQQTTQIRMTGPLPDPVSFAGYNEVLPGAAERLLAMVENEQKHRMTMDLKDHELSKFSAEQRFFVLRRGQWIAGILAGISTGGGVWAIVHGGEWIGIAAILGTLGTLATAFIWDRRRVPSPAQNGLASPSAPQPAE